MPVPDRVASRWRTSTFESWLRVVPTSDVDRRHADIQPDEPAKILFTSGSTGTPKGVINTHRMICSNQQMILQALPCLGEEPPVLVDWLPWHHTFGGNHNIGIVVYNGGSLYLDEGRPLPGAFEESVRNLRDVAPTIYLNVPKGYEELVRAFRKDPELAASFFARVACSFMLPPACRSTSPTSSRRLPLPPAASVSCSSLASAPPKRRRWRSAGRGRAISRRPSDCRSLASKSSWPRPW